jgi:hypothetical protein
MTDELAVCVAAYFRSIGKDVTTSEEFVMTASLKMKWMSPSDAKSLLAHLVSRNLVTSKDGFIRPNGDVSSIDVPMAYRPSAELVARVHGGAPAPQVAESKVSKDADVFQELKEMATGSGMVIGEFVKNCNTIQKRLNIDIRVAALIVLRDKGLDVGKYVERVYTAVSGL